MKIHDLLCENSGFSAPKARNVTAWAIGPGGVRLRFVALKARNESGTSEILKVFSRALLFRAFSASGIVMTCTQGVALGYHIPRLWRWETEFSLGSAWVLGLSAVVVTKSVLNQSESNNTIDWAIERPTRYRVVVLTSLPNCISTENRRSDQLLSAAAIVGT